MSKLNITPNSPEEPQPTQNQQIYIALQSIQSNSSAQLTQNQIDFSQTAQNTNSTTTSTEYVNLPAFSFSLTPANSLCAIAFSLTLQGTGYIGLVINNQMVRQIPFLNGTFSQVVFSNFETLTLTKQNVTLQWKAISGTLTLSCSAADPFYNRMQVVSLNS